MATPAASVLSAKAPASAPQIKIAATYMRGGTSKGVFMRLEDLPPAAQTPGPVRDHLLQRIMGSPDAYGKQTDGMGAATSSTSKCVILSPSQRPGHDVDYLYGQVSIDADFVDWSGNCGNLSTAAGAFAIHAGYVPAERLAQDGVCAVRIWQANIGKTIIAHVPVAQGAVQETGDFSLDGVTFPSAEIVLEFIDPADDAGEGAAGALLPTGKLTDVLEVEGQGRYTVSLINSGIPTIFINAADLGFTGCELQEDINANAATLARLEAIRAAGALKMGLIDSLAEAAQRQHTPKLAWVAPAQTYTASSGKTVAADDIDVCVRAMSMGKLHHAMMGTASVAIATAAAMEGTLVHTAAGGGSREVVRFGHPSGVLRVGAQAQLVDGQWQVTKAVMSRSARILMSGWVHVPPAQI